MPSQHLEIDRLLQAAKLPALAAVALTLAVTASASANDAADRSEAEAAAASVVVQPHREARFDPVQPQAMESSTILVAVKDRNRKVRIDSPRGGLVFTASQLASHDLPQAAMSAYQDAAASMASTDPACHLPWTLLAAIGRVESDHGRYGGSVLATDGVSRPEIIGVALNGKGPVAAIHDTDRGRLDGDATWDRAVGPMQFIPSTWAWAGRDGDGDGRLDPHDLDDAALAAGDYLCSGADLRDSDTMDAAILRYNPSDYYVALVRAFEAGYRTGVFVLPSPDAPADDGEGPGKKKRNDSRDRDDRVDRDDRDRPKRGDRPKSDPTPSPKPSPKPKPKPKADPTPTPRPAPAPATQPAPQPAAPGPQPSEPSRPEPSPTPSPSPSPSPTVETFTGTLRTCPGGWCLDDDRLDLGPDAALTEQAAADYDGDGTVGILQEELAALATGGTVNVRAVRTDGVLVVRELAGKPFPR